MMGLGVSELIIVLVIALVIFGAGKLPEIGTSLGKSIQNFKKASSEAEQTPKVLPKQDSKPEESQENNPKA